MRNEAKNSAFALRKFIKLSVCIITDDGFVELGKPKTNEGQTLGGESNRWIYIRLGPMELF